MEIHKHKPIHNWREFLKEYAIIVIGVLTALGAEQAVENWHQNSRAAEARANIRAEIANNLGLIQVRAATEKCISQRLADVDALIQQAAAGKPAQDVVWIGHPIIWALPDSGYRSETQAGHVSLLPGTEQTLYAGIYAAFAQYIQAEEAEQKAWADLRALEERPSISAVMDWQLRSAVKQARTARWSMEAYGLDAIRKAKKLDLNAAGGSYFKLQSVCVPLHTSRPNALKLVVENRPFGTVYDEP